MQTHTIFCSACDRDVAVVARSGGWPAALAGGEVGCAENGVRCTGTACPFCATPLTGGEREEAARAGIASTAV